MFFVFCLGLTTGLMVAWNIWSQPQWLKNLITKTVKSLHEGKTP